MLRKDLYKFPVDLGGRPARQDWEEGKNTICFFKAKTYRFESFFYVVFSCGFRMVILVVRRFVSGHFFLFLKLMMDVVFWGPGEKIDDSQL